MTDVATIAQDLRALLGDPDACGEYMDEWDPGATKLEKAAVEHLPRLLTAVEKGIALRTAAELSAGIWTELDDAVVAFDEAVKDA